MDATTYMLKHTDAFIAKVFEGEARYIDSCGGMISAHGDKVEQYRQYWESKGLDFNKAQIIYFLTFTKLLGDVPKHTSRAWVVANYDTYKDMLPSVTPKSDLEAIVDVIVQNQDKFNQELDISRVLYPRDFLMDNLGQLETSMVELGDEFGLFCKCVVQLVTAILTAEQKARDVVDVIEIL